MRFETMTNLKKSDKPAADVLLYTQKCMDAIRKIPAPKGIAVFVTTQATDSKQTKVVKRAAELWKSIAAELDKADAAADRASRKRTKAK
jgi:hypothetical protein